MVLCVIGKTSCSTVCVVVATYRIPIGVAGHVRGWRREDTRLAARDAVTREGDGMDLIVQRTTLWHAIRMGVVVRSVAVGTVLRNQVQVTISHLFAVGADV